MCPIQGPGVRSGPGRPATWHPASSSAGLVPTGGPPARNSGLGKIKQNGLRRGRFERKQFNPINLRPRLHSVYGEHTSHFGRLSTRERRLQKRVLEHKAVSV